MSHTLQQLLFIVLPAIIVTLPLLRGITSLWLRTLVAAIITAVFSSVAALLLGYNDPRFAIGVVLIFVISFVVSLATSLIARLFRWR